MLDPKYHFSDGTELDCLEEAQHKVGEYLDEQKDFSVYVSETELRFVNLGDESDVQRNSR